MLRFSFIFLVLLTLIGETAFAAGPLQHIDKRHIQLSPVEVVIEIALIGLGIGFVVWVFKNRKR